MSGLASNIAVIVSIVICTPIFMLTAVMVGGVILMIIDAVRHRGEKK